jgi:phage-related protein
MSDSSGFQVATADLNKFADYLSGTTVSEIDQAAQGVQSANGFDIDAFGLILGQAMGWPCRVAMGVVADQLKSLSSTLSSVADATRNTATRYSVNESTVATSFQNIQGA